MKNVTLLLLRQKVRIQNRVDSATEVLEADVGSVRNAVAETRLYGTLKTRVVLGSRDRGLEVTHVDVDIRVVRLGVELKALCVLSTRESPVQVQRE